MCVFETAGLFSVRTSLGAAGHACAVHTSGEPRADINAGLQHIAGTSAVAAGRVAALAAGGRSLMRGGSSLMDGGSSVLLGRTAISVVAAGSRRRRPAVDLWLSCRLEGNSSSAGRLVSAAVVTPTAIVARIIRSCRTTVESLVDVASTATAAASLATAGRTALGGPIARRTQRPGARIASVLCLAWIAITRGIGVPGTVQRAG
jgi:hypothetical protein